MESVEGPRGRHVKFQPTGIDDVWLIELERFSDERGHFARTFCRDEFRAHGIDAALAQTSLSFNLRRGTLRGLHWQAAPHGEGKLVRCTRGAIWDVAVDIRPRSKTFCRWVGFELSADNDRMLWLGPGLAHGFVTRLDASEVAYAMSVPFAAGAGRGARYDDPRFAIAWPEPVLILAERDRSYPDFMAEES